MAREMREQAHRQVLEGIGRVARQGDILASIERFGFSIPELARQAAFDGDLPGRRLDVVA